MIMVRQGAQGSRETFRRYLEKAGVIDSLVCVLVSLYEQPERPEDPLEYVKEHIGAAGPTLAEIEAAQQEVKELREKCAKLTEENKDLTAKLQQYETTREDEGRAS